MNKPELHHQFLINTGDRPLIDGCVETHCKDTRIQHHPLLPVHDIPDAGGKTNGKIIGWAVTASGVLVSETQHWPISVSDTGDKVESCIYDHGGRFLVVLKTSTFSRIYLDPSGMLDLVYETDRKLAGSTVTALACDNPEHPIWQGVSYHLPLRLANQNLPAGLTADPKVSRLLPNHYLDRAGWNRSVITPMKLMDPSPAARKRDIVIVRIL